MEWENRKMILANGSMLIIEALAKAGARSAALYALFFYLHRNPVIPVDALVSALGRSGISGKVDLNILL